MPTALQRERYNEEYCNNLLLGALKFSDASLPRSILESLCEEDKKNSGATLRKSLQHLKPEDWRSLEVHLQPAVLIENDPFLQKAFGKTGKGLEADAWIRVGDCLVIVEGEFQKWIDANQMFQQLAIMLIKTDIDPKNLFWLLFNGRHPSWAPGPLKPERIGLSRNSEKMFPCVSRQAAALMESHPQLTVLADTGYLETHYLWQTWEWLAKRILEAPRSVLNPIVRAEISWALGKGKLHYPPEKPNEQNHR